MAKPSQNNPGFLSPNKNASEYNHLLFIIQQEIAKISTLTLVKVVSCTNSGELSPVGFVDVIPLVNMIDAQGNPTQHATIFNVPYMRMQGGANAVIIDPSPGDIGMCGFASRDISKVKKSKKQDNPGSRRRFSFSDGLYLGGFLNAAPTQYVRFSDDGIELKSHSKVTLEAPDIELVGNVNQEGGSVAIGGNTDFSASVTKGGVDLAKIDHTHAVSGSATGPGLPGSSGA